MVETNSLYPTLSTRALAHESVDKQKRYDQILECLDNKELTAKEIAVKMYEKGYIPNSERNFTAPRLTELSKEGIVEPIGKTKCKYTGKTVAVYRVRKEEKAEQLGLGLIGEVWW